MNNFEKLQEYLIIDKENLILNKLYNENEKNDYKKILPERGYFLRNKGEKENKFEKQNENIYLNSNSISFYEKVIILFIIIIL
jgi:hypothetical protein